MSEPLTNEELEQARDLGAATYVSAYLHLMARHLGVDDTDQEALNAMAARMVPTLNAAIQAAWCALVNDVPGRDAHLNLVHQEVHALP